MEIFNSRPANMSYKEYRTHLIKQKEWIKRGRVLGQRVWAPRGVGIPTLEDIMKGHYDYVLEPMGSFVGKVKDLSPLQVEDPRVNQLADRTAAKIKRWVTQFESKK